LKNALKSQKDTTFESVKSKTSLSVNQRQNLLINDAAAFQRLNSFPSSGKTTQKFVDVGISTCSVDVNNSKTLHSDIKLHKSMVHNVSYNVM
jgi:hypothetical protein